MTDRPDPLQEAIARQLQDAHDIDADAAADRARRMAPALRPRFAIWVRRELAIQRGRERVTRTTHAPAPLPPGVPAELERLSLNVRLQHAIMAISVIVLVITGLPLKFNEYGVAKAIIGVLGGPDVTPLIHRVAATFLAIVGVWHLGWIALTPAGRSDFKLLLPGPKDAVDAYKQIRYYLGRSDERPRFDRFSYIEKFDYWAVYWGMLIMIGTGTMLWFTDFFLRFTPKWLNDIAKEAHSDEALLATLAIVIWHFYNVHFNPHSFPVNRTFLTGKISARSMIEEHPLEFERVTGVKLEGTEDTQRPGGAS